MTVLTISRQISLLPPETAWDRLRRQPKSISPFCSPIRVGSCCNPSPPSGLRVRHVFRVEDQRHSGENSEVESISGVQCIHFAGAIFFPVDGAFGELAKIYLIHLRVHPIVTRGPLAFSHTEQAPPPVDRHTHRFDASYDRNEQEHL